MSPLSPQAGAPARDTGGSLPVALKVLAMALGLRLVSSLVGFLANVTFPHFTDQHFTVFKQPNAFWDTFARYDAGWYYGIAAHGYAYVEGGRNNLAFFPLYPLFMRWGGLLLGGEQQHFYIAGIIISWSAFAAGLYLLYLLARVHLCHGAALRAVVYAAIFPSAYFFGRVYSESMFFAALVGMTLALQRRQWSIAALVGAAMTATRVNGITFIPALAWVAWTAAGPETRPRLKALAAVGGATAGFVLYCAYSYALSGDPLAWYYSILRWGYQPGGNPLSGLWTVWQALLQRPYEFLANGAMAPYDAFNACIATAALCAVPFVWRRFGAGYAAVVVLGLALPLSSGQSEGLGRYSSVLFPLPLLLGSLGGEARHMVLMTGSAMLYSLGLALFVNVHPLF